MAVDRRIVRVYLVALEVEEQVVYKLLLVPVVKGECEPREAVRRLSYLSSTYCALLNTTAMESELHLNRFGAITSAKFAGVIFVAACILSSKNNCKKLITNNTTLLLIVGSRFTCSTHASGSFELDTHTLYISSGTNGSQSSRSQSFIKEARTFGSPTPSRV